MKKLIIVGGANGVGKTTFAKSYIEEVPTEFLNADEIAKELELQGDVNAMIKAGRSFFKRLYELFETEESFVVESTLSGSYLQKIIPKAQELGYQVQIIYIFLDNPQTCIERIKGRVLKGGHHVPNEDVIRRFYRSKHNFWNFYINFAKEWVIFFNGLDGFQQVVSGSFKNYTIENQILFNLFQEK